MFEAEARWLRGVADLFPPERLPPLLNLGSSSTDLREIVQPWIEDQLFRPLRARGVKVVHVDKRELLGVDVQADLTNHDDVVRLEALHSGAPLCCNLLEYVTEPDRLAYHCLDLGVWRTCVRHRSLQLSLSWRPDRHDVSAKPFRPLATSSSVPDCSTEQYCGWESHTATWCGTGHGCCCAFCGAFRCRSCRIIEKR